LARLEAHSRSRRNVQAIPKSSLSIKSESRIGLGEMIMTAELGAGHAEHVAQHPEQRRVAVDIDAPRLTVELIVKAMASSDPVNPYCSRPLLRSAGQLPA
jgi:hypothetical protein